MDVDSLLGKVVRLMDKGVVVDIDDGRVVTVWRRRLGP
jgi:hypothetical protein